MKEVDSLTGEYIYRNRRTGNVTRRKPIFLGSDDLDTPRCVCVYFMYAKRDDDDDDCFLFHFVVTCCSWSKYPHTDVQILCTHE